MKQTDINKLWAERPQPNPKKATAYGLIKVREFEQEALALVRTLQK
jgi:hypothetical protein